MAPYLSWQGCPVGVRLVQFLAMLEKPMSLPPMPRVTAWVPEVTASSCAGLSGPGVTCWLWVMSSVVAPAQLMSVSCALVAAAARCA